jgi:tryptophan 2,3-dioxygenase
VARHFALMETMTTRDYLGFRDKLTPASGFQSAQLREIEILMGLKLEERLPLGHDYDYLRALRYPDGRDSPASKRVEARLSDQPTLHAAMGEWLYRTPIQGSTPEQEGDETAVLAFLERYLAAQAGELDDAMALAIAAAPNEADRTRLEQRYRQEMVNARTFLMAEDAPEDAALALVQDPRGAAVHRELPRAAAAGLAARGARRDRRARAGVRDLPAAPRADGRARGRAPDRHGRLGGRRLPRPDGAQVPHLPRPVGGADAADPRRPRCLRSSGRRRTGSSPRTRSEVRVAGPHVIVVGGGTMGLASAWALVAAGRG